MAPACCSPSATRPPGASSSGTRRPAAHPRRCRSPTAPSPSTPTSAPARTATSSPEGGKLYYAKLCQGDESGCPHRSGLIRYRYSTGDTARARIGRYDLWQARGEGITHVLHDHEGWRSCFSTATGGSPETRTLLATTPEYE